MFELIYEENPRKRALQLRAQVLQTYIKYAAGKRRGRRVLSLVKNEAERCFCLSKNRWRMVWRMDVCKKIPAQQPCTYVASISQIMTRINRYES